MITSEDVAIAFRILLGREPRTLGTLDVLAQELKTPNRLRRYMLNSSEFNSLAAATRRKRVQLDMHSIGWLNEWLLFDSKERIRKPQSTTAHTLDDAVTFALDALRSAPNQPTIFLSKSIPRSGHHYMVRLLKEYFGKKLSYCEFYKPHGCCKRIPCTKPRSTSNNNDFFMQKSHDFKFSDSTFGQYNFVIQYRHPIPQTQSNFELALTNETVRNTEGDFWEFAERQLEYYIAFIKKWVLQPPPQAMLLTYEGLCSNSSVELARLVEFMTKSQCNKAKILESIRAVSRRNSHSGEAFVARNIASHRFFDAKKCRELEERVVEGCPGLNVPRLFT